MHKLVILILVLSLVVLFAGCSSQGVPQEQYDQLPSQYSVPQASLAEKDAEPPEEAPLPEESPAVEAEPPSEADMSLLVEQLSTISAYMVWYEYFYAKYIFEQNDDVFNQRLGSLIAAIDDQDTQATFYLYYQADAAYRQVLADLPKDNSAWTRSQYDNWVESSRQRAEALGQVGGYLAPLLQEIEWFAVK